jgi:5'-nucleotidase/UDP-sugar diphosphatase
MLAVILFFSNLVFAEKLQIVHINDLHSFFNGSRDGTGGYARVKTVIDHLKNKAAEKNIPTLVFDGGDFGEGTSFFMSAEGINSLKALDLLGINATVIGNHDYMLGGKVFANQIKKANLKTKILSANFVHTPEMGLTNLVNPIIDYKIGDYNIRVIGLSTAEAHFQYPLLPGLIAPHEPIALELSQAARKAGKNLIIALTHLGLNTDINLVKKSEAIDLVIGGHSHTALSTPTWIQNKNGTDIPIFQAGSQGRYVGSIILNIENNQINLDSYELIAIDQNTDVNSQMDLFVQQSYQDLAHYFSRDIQEIIGYSNIELSGYKNGKIVIKQTCWGKHLAKITRVSSGADIGVHFTYFEGDTIPAGPIKFIDMIDNYPHFNKYGDPGWEIVTMKIPGNVLKTVIRGLVNLREMMGVTLEGVTYKSFKLPYFIPYLGGKIYSFNFRVNGEKISNKKQYSLAIPGEIAKAMKILLPEKIRKLLPETQASGIYYWPEIENYIKNNSPIECL